MRGTCKRLAEKDDLENTGRTVRNKETREVRCGISMHSLESKRSNLVDGYRGDDPIRLQNVSRGGDSSLELGRQNRGSGGWESPRGV